VLRVLEELGRYLRRQDDTPVETRRSSQGPSQCTVKGTSIEAGTCHIRTSPGIVEPDNDNDSLLMLDDIRKVDMTHLQHQLQL